MREGGLLKITAGVGDPLEEGLVPHKLLQCMDAVIISFGSGGPEELLTAEVSVSDGLIDGS